MCDLYDDLRRDAVGLFTLMKAVRIKEAQLKALREGGDPQQGASSLLRARVCLDVSVYVGVGGG